MKVEIMKIDNPGCNNGNYPEYRVVGKDGMILSSGITCRCGAGCSGTDRLGGADTISISQEDWDIERRIS